MKYSLIVIMLFLIASATAASAAPKTQDEIDLIENSIIVDGLSLTSEQPPADAEKEGSVIFNDDIVSEDPPAVKKVISDHRKRKAAAKEDSDDILRDLRKDDSRWHYSSYLVRKGDTLWSIARKFSSSHRLLVRINGMTQKETLRPGRKILVPNRSGIEYTVKRGDTVSALARRYRTDPSKILSAGRSIKSLRAGTTVFIADARVPAAKQILAPPKAAPHREEMIAKKDIHQDETPADTDRTETPEIARNPEPEKDRSVPASRLSFAWPLQGRITSGFGTRIDPLGRGRRRSFHNGMDISAEIGTPVKAAEKGTVIFSGWKDGYGKLVVVRHDNGYVTVYGHNSELKKNEGDDVDKGEIVSLSGMTGAVTGAHLHFEIQKYGTPLNPARLLK